MIRFVIASLILLALVYPVAAHADEPAEPQYGPLVCHSVTFVKPPSGNLPTWEGAVTRAMTVALADDTTVCYDAQRLSLAALWRGGFLDFGKTHHTSYKGGICPRPAAEPIYKGLDVAGWASPQGELEEDDLHLNGYYLHEGQAVLSYQVAGRDVLELPSAAGDLVQRDLQISGGESDVSLLIAVIDGKSSVDGRQASVKGGKQSLAAHVAGDAHGLAFRYGDGRLYLDIPAGKAQQRFQLRFQFGSEDELAAFEKIATQEQALTDLTKLTQGGTRRWNEIFTTKGVLSDEQKAYVLDDLTIPHRPYGSWMRLSAIDFFEDGRAAVATMPGDVWIVSWEKDDIGEIHWQRYATGLYEPLGLKIVDGSIYLRGRDRITRLHDLNSDGEADYFENFHSHGPIGPGYHAFIFDLNTDDDGNFWYVISGRKAPSIGEVIKVSPDGKQYEVIANHFRHPNGMGIGGPYGWVTIADNPGGKYPSGACLVKEGQSYGEGGPRTQPFLYLLPPKVDTSSGSQCWADPKRWGPLGGALVHTSYSTSSITYVLTQNSQPHPSGYAVHMPFGFKSGPMRLRVNSRDGQMYIAGQRGWDSNAAADGCLQRVRYTGQDAYLVTGAKATKAGVELTFSCELDPKTADFDNFFAARVSDKRDDEVDIDDVELLDERTVLVSFYEEAIDPTEIVDREATKRAAKNGDQRTHYRVVDPRAVDSKTKAHDGTPGTETS